MKKKRAFTLVELPAVRKRGFTLVELLVVIGIISILAVIVVINLSNARTKSRDARRKADVKTLSDLITLYHSNTGSYPTSSGWLRTTTTDPLYIALVTPPAGQDQYISSMPLDPSRAAGVSTGYMYWRKDSTSYGKPSLGANKYTVYANLEMPSAADSATMSDTFDTVVGSTWGMNFRMGN